MNDGATETPAASRHEVFWYTSGVTLALLIAVNTLPWYRCSPFHGILGTLLATVMLPWLVLPVLAVPGAVAALVVTLLRRRGSRQVWRRVLLAAVGVLVAVMAVATVASLIAPGSAQSCDLS
jgi:hypothetical protein